MTKFISWKGSIQVEYLYTSGIAGEKFFREIKDKERLVGSACPKCKITYLPPRLYCEQCFKTLEKWVPIPKKGTIYTYTISYSDINGKTVKEPVILAVINFKGVKGGIIHKIEEIKPADLKIGLHVVPVFEDSNKRKGNILDIKYFRPA
jgi:uncharacterized OB-fold protein